MVKLELPNIELERAHRVGQRFEHRFRPISVRFSRFCDREAVMRNVFKLRGTRIFINEDLCPASQNEAPVTVPALPLLTHVCGADVGGDGGGDGTSAHDSVTGGVACACPAVLSGGGDTLRTAAAAVSTPVSASTGGRGGGTAALSVPAGGAGILASGQRSTRTSSRAPKKQ